jgi:rhodanese-related sulfurtransferase
MWAVTTRALALGVLGGSLGLVLTTARTGLLRSRAPQTSCETPAVEPRLLSAADAARICATDRALIADTRSDAEYAAGHIAGALHLACDTRGDVAGAALANLADRSLVLVYGVDTASAITVARSIAQRLPLGVGPTVYALEGGFGAWEKAGLACASGPCEGCAAPPVSR